MQEITKILSSLRHPTQSFVNEDTFPSAIEAMPALKSVAASGFRGDKTFDDGFMSVASAAYDALTDSSIPGLEAHLAKMTIAAVNSIDAQLQNDKDFAKKAISELNISRFLKSKANDAFKAGALLAMATIAYSDEFPPDDDDDKDREVVKEKPLGVPVNGDAEPEEPKGFAMPPEPPKGLMAVLKAISVGFPEAAVEVISDFSVEPPKLAVRINMIRSSIPLIELMNLYARLTNVGLSKAELNASHDTLGFFVEILEP